MSNRRIVEWWRCRIVDSSIVGMVELSNRRVVESSNGGVVNSSNSRVVEWRSCRIVGSSGEFFFHVGYRSVRGSKERSP